MTNRIRNRIVRSRYGKWWEKLDLLQTLIQRDLEARYKGAMLGRAWVILNQVAQLLVYTYAFSIVLRTKPAELSALPISNQSMAYGLWLFTGLVPWTAFTQGLTQGAVAVLNQPNLVKKVIFPLELLPLVPVGSALIESTMGLMLLLSAIVLAAKMLPWTIALLPLVWFPQLLLTAGLSYFTAGLTVFLRDIPQTLMVITNLMFYLTPIVYSASILPGDWKTLIFWVNPMAAIVQLYRDFLGFRGVETIIVNGAETTVQTPIHWGELGIVWSISILIFILGYGLYRRLRRGFADVL
ncbi:ABC transporter permease [Romeriopsis navalis]|uniref:ABC transporter permease n=1 Tax=Romeriopsis navalis TaxID=2992132 RepID=UPI0021F8A426|nr:ABC transporter permease [Romeriopsis navalis]